MLSIDRSVIVHRLNIAPNKKPVKRKKRTFNVEKFATLTREIEKLLRVGFIKEVEYLE